MGGRQQVPDPKSRAWEGRDEVQRRWGEGRTRNGQAWEGTATEAKPGEEPDSTAGGRRTAAAPSAQHSGCQNPILLSLEPLAQRFEKKAEALELFSYLVLQLRTLRPQRGHWSSSQGQAACGESQGMKEQKQA